MNNKNAVLISIRPKWCEMICRQIGQDFNAKPVYKKSIEVRKSRPKLETPFKCYIYCTSVKSLNLQDYCIVHRNTGGAVDDWSGKVIGEFVCDYITVVDCDSVGLFAETLEYINRETCLDRDALWKYTRGRRACGWHISDLLIYDKPRELAEFGKTHLKKCDWKGCETCDYWQPVRVNADEFDMDCAGCGEISRFVPLTRPPQSWCYVEVKDD